MASLPNVIDAISALSVWAAEAQDYDQDKDQYQGEEEGEREGVEEEKWKLNWLLTTTTRDPTVWALLPSTPHVKMGTIIASPCC